MELQELQRHWDGLGLTDPLWAVLTDPSKRGGKWDVHEFFALGEQEISGVMEMIGSLGIEVHPDRALDFGCGVGRLTQALAPRFKSVCGLDIAPSMIEHARRFNRFEQCPYLVNVRADLHAFPADHFDFIYTNIVLQHMEPRYSKAYITDFMRVLKKGGVLIFQVPDRPRAKRLDKLAYNAQIRILSVPRTLPAGEILEVFAVVRNVSPVSWPGKLQAEQGYIRMGNHWLMDSGEIVTYDDSRVALPYDLPPGSEAELILTARAPSRPGSYILELDMVHECITWFKDAGSMTTCASIEVTKSAHSPPPRNDVRPPFPVRATEHRHQRNINHARSQLHIAQKPGKLWASIARRHHPEALTKRFKMEMQGVPRAEIEALIGDAKCRAAHVSASPYSGPEWVAWQYVVVKL